MKKYLIVALLASLLAGCAHDSPCVPVYVARPLSPYQYLYERHNRRQLGNRRRNRRGAAA